MLSHEIKKENYGKTGNQSWILPFNAVTLDNEGVFILDRLPPPSEHRFSCAGLDINLSLVSDKEGTLCSLWSDVGEFPYTAEDTEARTAGIDILRGAQNLAAVRFCVAKEQRICALFESHIKGHATLDALMVEILYFLQQTLPFVALIREKVCPKAQKEEK